MAVRHSKVVFSLEPTKSQAQRFFALILQNVTDFSGYTADPVIGTYLTGGNTVAVTAFGDNVPVTVIAEHNAGTANAVTVLQIGNLYHTIANSNVSSRTVLITSDQAASYIFPTDRSVNSITTSTHLTAKSLIQFAGSLEYTIRVSESYIAVARRIFVAGTGASATDSWKAYLCTKTNNMLQFVIRHDYWRTSSEFQLNCARVLVPAADVAVNKLDFCSILTNHGPITLPFDDRDLSTLASTTAQGAGTGPWLATLPGALLNVATGLNRKPVFQFKVYDANTGLTFDISGIHNVLMMNYGKADEYFETVTNGGTTYRAVGGFLFSA